MDYQIEALGYPLRTFLRRSRKSYGSKKSRWEKSCGIM